MAKNKPKLDAKMVADTKLMRAGNYSSSLFFTLFVAWLEAKFPGSAEWIEAAADILPWEKLMKAVMAAVADWNEGKDFLTILREALAEWVDIEPGNVIRMVPKPLVEPT